MKIIISPAKVQDGQYQLDRPLEEIYFPKKQGKLNKLLKGLSKNEIGQLMKIKNKLLDTTYVHLHSKLTKQHAINLYNGIVYKEINVNLYDDAQLMYMNEHLRILSAKHGVLRPLMGITPYRLDMTMKLDGINLYHYWQTSMDQYFKDETIINLASVEFSKMIPYPMVNIHFKEWINDQYKIVTVRAKKARGLMVDYMITHMIGDIEGIKAFDEDGYSFNPTLSDDSNIVFTKEI